MSITRQRPLTDACGKGLDKDAREKRAKPVGWDVLNVSDPALSTAIARHSEATVKDIGRAKAQVLRTIATYPIADLMVHPAGKGAARDARDGMGRNRNP